MQKKVISTIQEKNRIISNIIHTILEKRHFLILGHHNPDEDCVSSLTAFALLVSKFSAVARIYLGTTVHEHFAYLINICKYNSIDVVEKNEPVTDLPDVIVILDTPKPEMICMNPSIEVLMKNPAIIKIEIDHHLGADSAYCGDADYSLVTEASSACELIGHVALKMSKMKSMLAEHGVTDFFSRNITLAILSGIIGDSQMGKFLKTQREQRYYNLFSNMFNDLLHQQTVKESNFSSMEQVYGELQRLSAKEVECHGLLMDMRKSYGPFSYIVLDEKAIEKMIRTCGPDVFTSVSRSVVNTLAEESGKFGFVAYHDPAKRDLFQFRMRRSKQYRSYDLRRILPLFSIENGGGHEGAIGFRVPVASIAALPEYVEYIMKGIESDLVNVLQ